MASLSNGLQGYQWGSQAGSSFGPAGSLYGGVVGAIDGYFGGPIFKAVKDMHTAPDFPGLSELSLDAPTTGLDQYLTQLPYTERLNTALSVINNTDNDSWQKILQRVDPHAVDNAGALGDQINSYLHGQIPTDVQNQIRRNDAFKSLQGGFAGSPMASNLTARDFGLTSMDLIGKGVSALPTEASYDKFLNPSDLSVAQSFVSPTDLLSRDDRLQSYNNQIDNQNALIQYEIALANKTGNLGMLSGGFGLLGKTGVSMPGTSSSSSSGGMGGMMGGFNLGSLFGGGGSASGGSSDFAGSDFSGGRG